MRRVVPLLLALTMCMTIISIPVGAQEEEEPEENKVDGYFTLFFRSDMKLTPLPPVEFSKEVPTGVRDGYLGLGILPYEVAEYEEVGTWSTGALQAPLSFFDDTTISVPITAGSEEYFDLRVSFLLNGVTFAPPQEINNEISTNEIQIWELDFNTENKQVPSGGNLQVMFEIRTRSENMTVVSIGEDVFGLNTMIDPIDIEEIEYGPDGVLRMYFKECFNVPMNRININILFVTEMEGWSEVHWVEGSGLNDSSIGFDIIFDLYLEEGDHKLSWHFYYDGGKGYGTDTDFYVSEEDVPVDDPWSLTTAECARTYIDGRTDTWDFTFQYIEYDDEITLDLKRGKRLNVDINTVRSYKEDDDFVVEVEFWGDPSSIARCEVYIVNDSFIMPQLYYELGIESYDLPDVFFDIEATSSTDIYAEGAWWTPDHEVVDNTWVFREDLWFLEWDGMEADFEILVIAVDGEVDMYGSDKGGELHWDYAGSGVKEPILNGPDHLVVTEDDLREDEIDEFRFLGMDSDQLAVASVVGIVAFIVIGVSVIVVVLSRGSRKRKKFLESY